MFKAKEIDMANKQTNIFRLIEIAMVVIAAGYVTWYYAQTFSRFYETSNQANNSPKK